ncbi:MAG: translocation/assembly module TamB, partial [candidate division KSB1 bacterium]|nr:translocation/assembly module TamB [candidate division KSB1 bacterium]
GYLPLSLSLAAGNSHVYRSQPLQIRMGTNELSLAVLQPALALEVETIRGKISGDVVLENTLAEPRLKGFLRLENGALKMPAYGVNYDDWQTELRFDSTRVSIAHFQVRHNKGLLSASGYASFDSSLVAGNIHHAHITISTNEFLLASTKNYEISVKGDVELTGRGKQTQFSGAVTVLRSSFFLPALAGPASAATIEDTLPLLVAATTSEDRTELTSAARLNRQTIASEYYTNLHGTLKVEIPRNTWLRSPNMNVEISGSLDVVKTGPDFEIFGYIRTQRGNYDFYSKRFEIVNGTFTFQGGAEYNPKLQIEAQHSLRTADQQKKTLTLQITGDALEPRLNFTLDDDPITEGDAICYLFFGRSLNELTHGKKAGDGRETNETQIAQDLAAALLSAEISKALGKAFNLDVLEFKAQQNWQQASFVIGKYITHDLFVSYQKEFGDPKSNEVAHVLITLEYEVTPFLFLQLIKGDDKQSGYDIIFKFER